MIKLIMINKYYTLVTTFFTTIKRLMLTKYSVDVQSAGIRCLYGDRRQGGNLSRGT